MRDTTLQQQREADNLTSPLLLKHACSLTRSLHSGLSISYFFIHFAPLPLVDTMWSAMTPGTNTQAAELPTFGQSSKS